MKDHGEVASAFHHALESHGVSSEPDAFDVLRGRSKRDAIRRLLLAERGDEPSAVLESRVEAVHASFGASLTDLLRATGPTPVDGADDTFRWLRERAIKIALTTGFERSITMPLLDRLGWEAHAFDAVVCADDVAVGRPASFLIFRAMESARAVRVGHVMAVGDTESDLLAAANARTGYSVAVLSGAHRRARLERRPHTAILDSVAALPSLWD